MTTPNSEETVTARIHRYRNGEITWDALVTFFKEFPWHAPDLPDSGDYLAWDVPPNTLQAGTWGEVIGAHLDELLTDDDFFALMDVYDSVFEVEFGNEITMVKPGVVPIISNDYDDRDVFHPEAWAKSDLNRDDDPPVVRP